MNKIISFALICIFTTSAFAGEHWVNGYTKNDGTYVEGHYAGNPGSGTHCSDNVCY